jgi:hypothetical protein
VKRNATLRLAALIVAGSLSVAGVGLFARSRSIQSFSVSGRWKVPTEAKQPSASLRNISSDMIPTCIG